MKIAASGAVDVGIDSFAQKLIGRIDSVELPEVGKRVRKGDVLFAVRQDKRRAPFASPVDGIVTDIDKELAWRPEEIESDPYRHGRICSVMTENLAENLKHLWMAEDAKTWLNAEVKRFQEFFAMRPIGNSTLPGVNSSKPFFGRGPAAMQSKFRNESPHHRETCFHSDSGHTRLCRTSQRIGKTKRKMLLQVSWVPRGQVPVSDWRTDKSLKRKIKANPRAGQSIDRGES